MAMSVIPGSSLYANRYLPSVLQSEEPLLTTASKKYCFSPYNSSQKCRLSALTHTIRVPVFFRSKIPRHNAKTRAGLNGDSGVDGVIEKSEKTKSSKKPNLSSSGRLVAGQGSDTEPYVFEFNKSSEAQGLVESDSYPNLFPPFGFGVSKGEVVAVTSPEQRTVTIVDPDLYNRPLECLIRRSFTGPLGRRFFVLVPVDTPIQLFEISQNPAGLREIDDDQVDSLFPAASYALARKYLHLMQTGFCLTARGALCFSDDAIVNLEAEYGRGLLGNVGEGVEICKFPSRGREYILFTPFDPVMFVAYQDDEGRVVIAEEGDMLSDDAVEAAVAEEADFNSLVEEEEEVENALREAQSGFAV